MPPSWMFDVAPPSLLPQPRRSRRSLLAGAFGLGVAALLPSRANAMQTDAATPAASGWSFTDDHGVTISLPERPARIVAHVSSAATLWDYGIESVGVFGPLQREDGSREPLTGTINLGAVTVLSAGWGEIDVEALVELQPDLIVGTTYSPGVADDLWALDPDVVAKVRQIAPIAAISVLETSAPASLKRFEELAEALGANLDAPAVTAARERFEVAAEAVRTAAAEKPDLRVLVMSAWPEAIYIANPAAASDLIYFTELGVALVIPQNADGYWEELSWEQALKYPADLILLDERDGGYTVETLDDAPVTFAAHPAVQAGQVGNWYTEFGLSYDAFAAILEELAGDLRVARVLG